VHAALSTLPPRQAFVLPISRAEDGGTVLHCGDHSGRVFLAPLAQPRPAAALISEISSCVTATSAGVSALCRHTVLPGGEHHDTHGYWQCEDCALFCARGPVSFMPMVCGTDYGPGARWGRTSKKPAPPEVSGYTAEPVDQNRKHRGSRRRSARPSRRAARSLRTGGRYSRHNAQRSSSRKPSRTAPYLKAAQAGAARGA